MDRPRRNSTTIQLSLWGIAQTWLSAHVGRELRLRANHRGFFVIATDPLLGEHQERIEEGEEPSKAAMRAITRIDR